MVESVKNEIVKLIEQINYYDKKYYEEGISEISDNEYDRLYESFLSYLEQYPEIEQWKDIPTHKVGAGKDANASDFVKITHKSPLLSIDQKSRDISDLKKWYEKLESPDVIVEPKLDGITVNINYENGEFINAATRGNGIIGDLITEQFKNSDTVYPQTLSGLQTLELRGEAIIPLDYFESSGMSQAYSNPRNAVAGIMHSKNPADVKHRGIQVMFYDIGVIDDGVLKNLDSSNLSAVYEYGFSRTPYIICRSWEELEACVRSRMNGFITSLNGFNVLEIDGYPQAVCDGIVIKSNRLDVREELGFSQKGPKWAFALKFKPLWAKTVLRDVEWQVAKSGRITPVAVFDEIALGGTKITKATLNNIEYIHLLPVWDDETSEVDLNTRIHLHYGDTIIVERSNDVIPRIVAVAKTSDGQAVTAPDICPVCGEPLTLEGPLLYCYNEGCPAQITSKIVHYASRNAMDITGLGEVAAEMLYDAGLLNSLQDIYRLKDHRDELLKLPRFGKKSVDNLLSAIENAKNRDFGRFLFALSIPHIGRKMADDIAKQYKTVDGLINNYSYNQILMLESFGEVYAKTFCDWISNIKNVELMKELLSLGVNPAPAGAEAESDKLAGKTFVITGTLSNTRDFFVDLIIKNGGKVGSSVSKKTNYVLAGENAGSKLEKAEKLGITIINEKEFAELIEA